ncbi:BLOC-1-related complex subunit 8 isoform X2 [Aplysia californica]|uniref:BLOC-1-related complex subunit 8 isoform X2 n=1 Tax=Aplysia californica TaxID=6500 RepID=A0ABM1W4W0_APLCA|nr:BLOC-1-related complex subunit 8 isoform X2 [Aplysia californica]
MGDSTDRFQSIMHAGDSLYTRMASQPLYKENPVDPDLEHKAKKVSDKFSENVNVIANEPSLAFYRIQEHVRKTLPQLVDQKHEVEDIQAKVQGACFDAEYATNAVKAMQNSAIHFQNIQDLLKNAMFMKQQISYEDARRRQGRASPSVGGRGEESEKNEASGAAAEGGQGMEGGQRKIGQEQDDNILSAVCPCSPKKSKQKNTTEATG